MTTTATPKPTPPLYGSELERKAAEVRARQAREKAERGQFVAQQTAEAATLKLTLAQPCPEHDVGPGKPCWKLSADDLHHRPGKAVCGQRISQALGVAKLRREREAREKERETEREQRRQLMDEGHRRRLRKIS